MGVRRGREAEGSAVVGGIVGEVVGTTRARSGSSEGSSRPALLTRRTGGDVCGGEVPLVGDLLPELVHDAREPLDVRGAETPRRRRRARRSRPSDRVVIASNPCPRAPPRGSPRAPRPSVDVGSSKSSSESQSPSSMSRSVPASDPGPPPPPPPSHPRRRRALLLLERVLLDAFLHRREFALHLRLIVPQPHGWKHPRPRDIPVPVPVAHHRLEDEIVLKVADAAVVAAGLVLPLKDDRVVVLHLELLHLLDHVPELARRDARARRGGNRARDDRVRARAALRDVHARPSQP